MIAGGVYSNPAPPLYKSLTSVGVKLLFQIPISSIEVFSVHCVFTLKGKNSSLPVNAKLEIVVVVPLTPLIYPVILVEFIIYTKK